MNLSVNFPPEVEAALRQRAASTGKNVETLVAEIVIDDVAEQVPPRERSQSHADFMAKLHSIIELHGGSNGKMDDSRESIYAGRGE